MSNPIVAKGGKLPIRIYEELGNLKFEDFQNIMKDIWIDMPPYIEDIGEGFYKINGDDKFFYITNYQGAVIADKALKEAAKNYVYVK